MIRVAIFGAGGLGQLVRDILLQQRRYRAVAFLDSDPTWSGRDVDGLRVEGGLEAVARVQARGVAHALVAVGDNSARVALAEKLTARGMTLVSAIHPLATISPTATLAEHLIIGPRATICIQAQVGPHTVISSGAIVEHDNVLGAGVFLHPAARLAGTVTVDDLATIGIGACVIPGRRVGRGARVEPGSVVIRDVPPGGCVAGIPAQAGGHGRPDETLMVGR